MAAIITKPRKVFLNGIQLHEVRAVEHKIEAGSVETVTLTIFVGKFTVTDTEIQIETAAPTVKAM